MKLPQKLKVAPKGAKKLPEQLVARASLHHPDYYNSILKIKKHCGFFYTVYHAGSYMLVLIVNVTFHGFRFWSKHSRYIILDY